MAKRESRVVVVEGDVAATVDEAHERDATAKNASYRDKASRAQVGALARGLMQEDELSIRLVTEKTSALVAVSQRFSVNALAEGFDAVREGVENGLLGDAVTKKTVATVAPAKLPAVLDALQKAGLADAVVVDEK